MSRQRSSLASIALIAAVTCAMGTVAAVQQPGAPGGHIETRPAAAEGRPESRAEGMEALHNATAAAVVAVLSEQFGGRTIAVKLDSTDVQLASLRDRVVSGQGRVQIGAGEDWIGFHYRTLYDTLEGSAGHPRVTLGGGPAGERQVANDANLVKSLDARLATELRKEFASQPVRLKLGEVSSMEMGARYLRIDAQGIADFGRDGSTPARVDALYDLRDNIWLRVDYELGPAVSLVDEVALSVH
jgi:hypothetical protein